MSSSSITAGDHVLVTITKGRASDRGTFPAIAHEHADVAGLLVADLDDREIVLQRPSGEQPFQVEVAR